MAWLAHYIRRSMLITPRKYGEKLKLVNTREYQPNPNGLLDEDMKTISDVWSELPPGNHPTFSSMHLVESAGVF